MTDINQQQAASCNNREQKPQQLPTYIVHNGKIVDVRTIAEPTRLQKIGQLILITYVILAAPLTIVIFIATIVGYFSD